LHHPFIYIYKQQQQQHTYYIDALKYTLSTEHSEVIEHTSSA